MDENTVKLSGYLVKNIIKAREYAIPHALHGYVWFICSKEGDVDNVQPPETIIEAHGLAKKGIMSFTNEISGMQQGSIWKLV